MISMIKYIIGGGGGEEQRQKVIIEHRTIIELFKIINQSKEIGKKSMMKSVDNFDLINQAQLFESVLQNTQASVLGSMVEV